MSPEFRFAVISDAHIALPETIWQNPSRFHMVEVSIAALEQVFAHLETLDLDFLLLPGDLTQHGEPANHAWLAQRLSQLPFPCYVVPGNHDVPNREADGRSIGLAEFAHYYQAFGYDDPAQPYYSRQVLPGVRLIGLNSNQFDETGQQQSQGAIDAAQMRWLREVLAAASEELVMVMVHHNVAEHLPNQSRHAMGRRYILRNHQELLEVLQAAGVPLVFTGHLHIQDIARSHGLYDITTGSLVSYPHPYRVLAVRSDPQGQRWLEVVSERVTAVPDWPRLTQVSRQWMGDRSQPFMVRLLTEAPLNLPLDAAESLAPELSYFWADISRGDALFEFPDFPPAARRFFESFSALDAAGVPHLIDNHTALRLD
ncbi:metallophosphoesterase [Geitlerinema sp. PCC 7407]|uniref:metallophosphoesterase family protein n=1 Tax=Geitlerinema sp. PCC 7407 TaxID=1173025 RepID=UPI00029FD576|nr:metallophosphoesterase [Geitlerinema sp. PCC 7407]AFY68092.1 metallophosphoesterase [Geitlerinema sp. PCC 7407]